MLAVVITILLNITTLVFACAPLERLGVIALGLPFAIAQSRILAYFITDAFALRVEVSAVFTFDV